MQPNNKRYLIIFFLILQLMQFVKLCQINQETEGHCVEKASIINDIYFCRDNLPDYICIPFYHEIWPEWNVSSIDQEIQKTLVKNIEEEFMSEIAGSLDMNLINNPTCLQSYIKYICKINFIPCDKQTDKTTPLCKSVCDSFVNSCKSNFESCKSLNENLLYSSDPNCFY